MGVFNLESFLCVFGLSGFSFFAIEHSSKTRKPRKIFISSFLQVLRPFTLFRDLFKGFCVLKTQLSKCCSKLSTKPNIETWKQLFLLLKPKWYLDNKLVAFSSFPVMVIVNTGCFLFRKLSVNFQHFRVFVFYHRTHSKTRNLRKVSFLLIFEVRFLPDIICWCVF